MNLIKLKQLLILILLIVFCLPVFAQNITGEDSRGLVYNSSNMEILMDEKSPYKDSKNSCYVFALGVSGPFDDNNLSTLSFPEDDCKSFVNAIDRMFKFSYDIKHINMLDKSNSEKTFLNAQNLLFSLNTKTIKSGDIVFLYFSGHGLTFREKYYFPLKDALVDRHYQMLTGADIIEVAEKLAKKGAKVFIFIDTCESGSILYENVSLDSSCNGCIIVFPATSATNIILEKTVIRGSVFGNKIVDILSCSEFENNKKVNSLTSQMIIDGLSLVMEGVKPVCYNVKKSTLQKWEIISDLQIKVDYNNLIDQYSKYIKDADECIKNNDYQQAISWFSAAKSLEKSLFNGDVKDYKSSILTLNSSIRSFIDKTDYEDSNWKKISSIEENNTILDKSVVDFAKLYYGCAMHYKSNYDYENAAKFFLKAREKGDFKNSSYELYLISENRSVPKINPITEDMRKVYLNEASNAGNQVAYKILNPVIEKPVVTTNYSNLNYNYGYRSNFLEDLFYDDSYWGVALNSDFSKYPIGVKGDLFWGIFHLGLDFMLGNDSFKMIESSVSTIVNSDNYTKELIDTKFSKVKGRFSYTITPGLFYKYVSLDCGFGQIFTTQTKTDTYKLTEQFSNGILTSTVTSTYNEEEKLNSKYFVYKPGITGLIPLDDYNDTHLMLGIGYRICPKNKNLNSFEASIGIAYEF